MGDILTVLAHITQDLLGTLHGLIVTVFASKRIQDRIRILQVKTLGKLNDSMHMGLARLVRLFSNHSPRELRLPEGYYFSHEIFLRHIILRPSQEDGLTSKAEGAGRHLSRHGCRGGE